MTAPALAALEPVRQRLQRDADEQAARLREAARAQAASILRQAQEAAAAALAEAAADAAATVAPLRAAELRRARDAARSAVLAAQREAWGELLEQVRAGVAALPGQAGYDQLILRITSLAEEAAGPHAQVASSPAGGVVARADGVIVDCSLARLADLAVAGLGAAIRDLWTS
jgi:vacuolar-type H+-ATPase subunit E/Vma4